MNCGSVTIFNESAKGKKIWLAQQFHRLRFHFIILGTMIISIIERNQSHRWGLKARNFSPISDSGKFCLTSNGELSRPRQRKPGLSIPPGHNIRLDADGQKTAPAARRKNSFSLALGGKMALIFRKMTTDDLPAVFSVRTSTKENAITMEELKEDYGITPESLAKAMKSHVSGWLCEESNIVVGFSMGDRSNGEVQVVAVHPDYEGRGIGKTLLGEVQKWLFSSGHKEIWLGAYPDPTIRAYGFYRKLGWQATGKMKGCDEILVFRDVEC